MKCLMRRVLLALLLAVPMGLAAQDTEKENQVTADIQLLTHGEIRRGGLPKVEGGNDRSSFLLGRSRLVLGYERPYIQANLNIQHTGIWGQEGKGSVNVYEAWAKLNSKIGLFMKVGRQVLSYDDERIIGPNDWAMAGVSHDVLKVGCQRQQFALGMGIAEHHAKNFHY